MTDWDDVYTWDQETLDPKNNWAPGDPCYSCGSKDTVEEHDGAINMGAHCNGCGRSDWDDD